MGNFATDKLGAGTILWSPTERPIVAPNGTLYWDVTDENFYIRRFDAWSQLSLGSSAISGTILANQVAVGSAPNTIAGSNNFTFNAATQVLSILGTDRSLISMDASGNIVLQSGTFTNPSITLFHNGNIDINSHGLVRVLGTGAGIFQVDSTAFELKLTLFGQTSGSASISVNPVAGTPNTIELPTTTGTSGQVLSTDGGNPQQLSWTTPNGGGSLALTSLRRRTSVYTDGSSTTFVANGDVISVATTGSASSSSQGIALNHGSGVLLIPTGVNIFGMGGNVNYNTTKNLSFLFVGAPGRITNERYWFGLSDQLTSTMVGSDNPAGNYAAFRFSTIAGDTNYQCITKDNTTQTVTDSGVTPVAFGAGTGPGVLFSIVFVPTAGSLTSVQFYINGTLVATNTTHLPNSGVAVGLQITIGGSPTVNNTNAGIFFEQVYVEQDSY